MKTQQQGARGEKLAREFLEHHGYEFVQANFSRRVGEIDLVMHAPPVSTAIGATDELADVRTIVFVEVRYRSSSDFGGAIASVDWRKQRKMIRVANTWLQQYASSRDCARIDVIALQPTVNTLAEPELYHWRKHDLLWIQNAAEEVT